MFSSVTRFTLLLGTHTAILMQNCGNDIDAIIILSYNDPQFYPLLLAALNKKSEFPLKIIIDRPGLDLVQDTLPPVSPWTRKKILDRQSAYHLPHHLLRASWIVKDASSWMALHAGYQSDEFFTDFFNKIQNCHNHIEPLSFFVMEAAHYSSIFAQLPREGWVCLMIPLQTSGLRQIILNNGRPVFTRLSHDCSLDMKAVDFMKNLLAHKQSIEEYLPRLIKDASQETWVPFYIFLPNTRKDFMKDETLFQAGFKMIVLDVPHKGAIPVEWESDIAWMAIAARQKYVVMPVMPPWLTQRHDFSWKRQVASWILLLLGCAGIYAGSNTLLPLYASQEKDTAIINESPLQTVEAPASLKLDAIIYNGPADWAVWINGQKHAPDMKDAALKIIDINSKQVVVRWQNNQSIKDYILFIENGAQGAIVP